MLNLWFERLQQRDYSVLNLFWFSLVWFGQGEDSLYKLTFDAKVWQLPFYAAGLLPLLLVCLGGASSHARRTRWSLPILVWPCVTTF